MAELFRPIPPPTRDEWVAYGQSRGWVDYESAASESHLDIARLTWGAEGQDALETIAMSWDGIVRTAVDAALGEKMET